MKATFGIAILFAFSLAGCASLTRRIGDVETVSLVNTSSPVSVRTAFIEDAADNSAAPKQLNSTVEIDTEPQKTLGFRSVLDLSSIEKVDLPTKDAPFWNRLANDQINFYSKESLMTLGVVFGSGALVANTDIDSQIQRHFQSSIQGASSREWFDYLHANKELGNGVYTLPIMGVACLANEFIDGPPAFELTGTWGERSLRGFFVASPAVVVMQRVTGGSRPNETADHSEWHPFRDNNGVSGHAFMSSLPFITAAKMTDDPLKKSMWYLGSTIGPLSRMNDNAHYPSQVGIGWAMAFVAASAVQQTDTGKKGWTLIPESSANSSGASLQYRW